MLSALHRLAARVRDELHFRLTGTDRATDFDLTDLPRLNKLLRSGGQPTFTTPPAPDPLRGEHALRVFELSPHLRDSLPLGLTPAHRERLLIWAILHSREHHKVKAADLLGLLAHFDTLPDRGLDLTYRLTPALQKAVPDALHDAAGWEKLKAHVRAEYRVRGRWLDAATLATPEPPPTGFGVNVAAHLEYTSGLQQVALGLVDALQRAGIPTCLRDLPVFGRADPAAPRKLGLERYDTTIVVAAVNSFLTDWYHRTGLWPRPGVRRIAVWYWEMEDVPAEWVPKLGWADEVWAATTFTAGTFRKVVTVPVKTVLPGLELPAFDPLPRSHFGLPDDRFLFLFTFDLHSTVERKNPLGLMKAFRRAFRPDEPVELVLKFSHGESAPHDLYRVRAAAEAGDGVRLIHSELPRGELLALMNCCDAYASLHRAEGLGLGMAEAMLMGKPVVATGYSGNLDFMTDANSYLVRCGRAKSTQLADPYPPGLVWGEPDVEHAAELLRRVYDHRDEARVRGKQARADLRERFAMSAYAERVNAALGK